MYLMLLMMAGSDGSHPRPNPTEARSRPERGRLTGRTSLGAEWPFNAETTHSPSKSKPKIQGRKYLAWPLIRGLDWEGSIAGSGSTAGGRELRLAGSPSCSFYLAVRKSSADGPQIRGVPIRGLFKAQDQGPSSTQIE
jgi:hypothetical protein